MVTQDGRKSCTVAATEVSSACPAASNADRAHPRSGCRPIPGLEKRQDCRRWRGPMSAEPLAPPDRVLLELLAARPVIALVGASSRTERPSHTVMRQLLEQRYPVIPVNPNEREVL